MKFNNPTGATPLDDISGLKPLHIATQTELNEWESANILKAEEWLSQSHRHKNILTPDFIRKLHQKMFDDTWEWAGIFRNKELNIGVEPFKITTELKNLLDDVKHQIKYNSLSVDETALRFHHRLVWIHPFLNGNGRHSRMMTDLLLIQNGEQRFSWGSSCLDTTSLVRDRYIHALKQADKKDYSALAAFVRS